MDALEDDDRVVHEHSDAQGEPPQAHDVEGDIAQIEPAEGDDDAQWNGEGDDGGAEERAQKEKEDDDGEHTADEGGVDDLVDGGADEHGAVGQELDGDALGGRFDEGWHTLFARRPAFTLVARPRIAFAGLLLGLGFIGVAVDPVADPLGDLDDVGVGLLEDLDLDALGLADAGDDLAVRHIAPHVGDVGQTHDGAAGPGNDELAELVQGAEFTHGPDQVFEAAIVELAAGEVDVFLPQAVDDLRRA